MVEEQYASKHEIKEFQDSLLMLEVDEISDLFGEDSIDSIMYWLNGAGFELLDKARVSFERDERFEVCALIRDKIRSILV